MQSPVWPPVHSAQSFMPFIHSPSFSVYFSKNDLTYKYDSAESDLIWRFPQRCPQARREMRPPERVRKFAHADCLPSRACARCALMESCETFSMLKPPLARVREMRPSMRHLKERPIGLPSRACARCASNSEVGQLADQPTASHACARCDDLECPQFRTLSRFCLARVREMRRLAQLSYADWRPLARVREMRPKRVASSPLFRAAPPPRARSRRRCCSARRCSRYRCRSAFRRQRFEQYF